MSNLVNIKWSIYKQSIPNGDLVSKLLIAKLDEMDKFAEGRIFIHRMYDADAKPGSQHRFGRAADIHIDGMDTLNQFLFAIRFHWGGLGVYGHDVWHNPGLHVDVRDAYPAALWAQQMIEGKKTYVRLDSFYLKHLLNI